MNLLARFAVAEIALCLFLSTFACTQTESVPAKSLAPEESIRVGDVERHYFLHVPNSLPKSKDVPLVLVFHGGGGHARNMPKFTGFDSVADAHGFVVAYPDGRNTHWNDTRGLSPDDDVAFIRSLLANLARTYPIDKRRVYATGISNGGFFSQRLACDLADKVAAVASVAATMPETLVPLCKPSRPISVMFMHGTEDRLVRVDGGVVGRNHGRSVSLEAAAKFWRDFNGTAAAPASEELPDRVPADGTRIHRTVYSGGKQGTEVVVYTIKGGGHTWPGSVQYLPANLIGRTSRELNASDVIWEFFEKQTIP